MNKTLLILMLAAVALAALPEDARAQYKPTGQPYRMPWAESYDLLYPPAGLILDAFGDREIFDRQLARSFADLSTSGIIDTAYGDTLVYYGHLIRTSQLSGWPRIAIAGLDSGKVAVDYRRVAYNNNTAAAGPWAKYCDTTTITTSRTKTAGAGGGRDTLIVAAGQPAADDTAFANNETGFIQFKYTFISSRAKKAGGYAKTHFVQPGAGFNHTWRGEAVITTRRSIR